MEPVCLLSSGDEGQDRGYNPHRALNLALSDWLLELMSAGGAAGGEDAR